MPLEPVPDLPACPFLPISDAPLTAACVQALGTNRGPEFYEVSLRYGQCRWQQGLPAQALLQINRALGADVPPDHPILARWPLPYPAAAWLLRHHCPGQFIGNPRRHYQHLATRMVEPRRELRTWRAWACWRIACILLPSMPADAAQIEKEGVAEPLEDTIRDRLERLGHPGEAAAWLALVQRLKRFVSDEPSRLNPALWP
ncbi:MAG: hypothetical protein KA004_01700 [Verrucomicrobiales bacterium]|nr:hypothetical protein [Verrucomicrobiales bacterium]